MPGSGGGGCSSVMLELNLCIYVTLQLPGIHAFVLVHVLATTYTQVTVTVPAIQKVYFMPIL